MFSTLFASFSLVIFFKTCNLMNNRILSTACAFSLSLAVGSLFAQTKPIVPDVIRATNTVERIYQGVNNNPGSNMPLMPLAKPETIGDGYLNKHWNRTTFILYGSDKTVEGYLTRYDLMGEELDVYFKDGVKVIKSDKIKSFAWLDSLTNRPAFFINGKDLKNAEGTPFTGFFEVLTEGDLPLFRKTKAELLMADFNATLNVGRRDNEIAKYATLYYMKDNVIYKMPKAMKKITAIFGEKEPQIQAYVKRNALRADTEKDVISLFEYFEKMGSEINPK